jgi:hypothetical protein
MAGLIIGIGTIVLTILLALFPIIFKVFKWTGLWIPSIYVLLLICFQSVIMKDAGGVTPAWCFTGLYITLGISGVIITIKSGKLLIRLITVIVDKARGY